MQTVDNIMYDDPGNTSTLTTTPRHLEFLQGSCLIASPGENYFHGTEIGKQKHKVL